MSRRRRSSAEEVAVFQGRVDALLAKEARCGACAKAARLAEGTMEPRICEAHQLARRRLAFG